MIIEYTLMHKDVPCGVLLIDSDRQVLESFANINKEYAPFFGNADIRLMRRWWEARAIPASRDSIGELLRQAGYSTTKEYLMKNLALSLTDTYWIQPVDADAKWDDVNLHANVFVDGKIPYHNQTSYDPNATLGGQMDKYWDMAETPPVLVKTAYKSYGQQAVNEAFATELHRRQNNGIPFAEYGIRKASDNGIQSLCPAFTSESIELVPAMEILDSRKIPSRESLYDAYISICSEHGLDEDMIREFMDYLTLTDFIITNTDEHLMNFGILRDTETMKCIAPAPIFDSGNSMFYSNTKNSHMTRVEMLEQKITGIYDCEEKILRRVNNRTIVKTDLLPTPAEVRAFYAEHGIPEQKAGIISQNYETKVRMLSEFQSGKSISLYHEKQRERAKI